MIVPDIVSDRTLAGAMHLTSRALDGLRLLFVLACFAALFFWLFPTEVVLSGAQQLTPDNALEERTIVLLGALRWFVPLVGTLGLVWLVLARLVPDDLQNAVDAATNSRWTLPIILTIALALRIFWLYWFPTRPYADSEWYMTSAENLAQGHGFIWDVESGQALVGWPIGYPALLAAFFFFTGPHLSVALGINVVMSLLTIAQTAWLGEILYGRRVGLLAAVLLAIFPGYIVYTSLASTDLVFAWLTSLCYLLIVRPGRQDDGCASTNRSGLAVGLANGVGILVRATGLMLLPFWLLLRSLARHSVKDVVYWGATVTTLSMMVVLPWTARNYVRFGKIIPVSTNGGMNFWIGNNPNAFGGFMFPRDAELNPLYPIIERRDEVGMEAEGFRLGREWLLGAIQSNPERVSALYRAKVFYSVASFDFGLNWNRLSAAVKDQSGTGLRALAIANGTYYFVLLGSLWGALALLLSHGRNRWLQWSPALFFCYWLLLHLPFFGQDRFMLPALPGLVMFCALGVSALFDATTRPSATTNELTLHHTIH